MDRGEGLLEEGRIGGMKDHSCCMVVKGRVESEGWKDGNYGMFCLMAGVAMCVCGGGGGYGSPFTTLVGRRE